MTELKAHTASAAQVTPENLVGINTKNEAVVHLHNDPDALLVRKLPFQIYITHRIISLGSLGCSIAGWLEWTYQKRLTKTLYLLPLTFLGITVLSFVGFIFAERQLDQATARLKKRGLTRMNSGDQLARLQAFEDEITRPSSKSWGYEYINTQDCYAYGDQTIQDAIKELHSLLAIIRHFHSFQAFINLKRQFRETADNFSLLYPEYYADSSS